VLLAFVSLSEAPAKWRQQHLKLYWRVYASPGSGQPNGKHPQAITSSNIGKQARLPLLAFPLAGLFTTTACFNLRHRRILGDRQVEGRAVNPGAVLRLLINRLRHRLFAPPTAAVRCWRCLFIGTSVSSTIPRSRYCWENVWGVDSRPNLPELSQAVRAIPDILYPHFLLFG